MIIYLLLVLFLLLLFLKNITFSSLTPINAINRVMTNTNYFFITITDIYISFIVLFKIYKLCTCYTFLLSNILLSR